MDLDEAVVERVELSGDTENPDPPVAADAPDAAAPQVAHSIMDVLRPANPPQPKNARIIRRFDLEAAKYDPQPGEPAAAKPPSQQSRNREEARALRNRSLAAAAGLV